MQTFRAPPDHLSHWPVLAAAYYAAARARLISNLPVLPGKGLRKVLSAGVTASLLFISAFGFYQLWSIYTDTQRPAAVQRPAILPPPSSVAAQAPKSAQPGNNATAAPETSAQGVLSEAAPNTLSIPAIGLASSMVPVGQNADGSLEVPPPDTVGWYKYAPEPGETGPAILVGHVDDITGPAVFANLKKLTAGDTVYINREDGRKVTFAVTRTATYQSDDFPTGEVYGNIDHAGLRLITCYGNFNQITRQYSHNLVIYAKIKS